VTNSNCTELMGNHKPRMEALYNEMVEVLKYPHAEGFVHMPKNFKKLVFEGLSSYGSHYPSSKHDFDNGGMVEVRVRRRERQPHFEWEHGSTCVLSKPCFTMGEPDRSVWFGGAESILVSLQCGDAATEALSVFGTCPRATVSLSPRPASQHLPRCHVATTDAAEGVAGGLHHR